jgi:hypothetical protein
MSLTLYLMIFWFKGDRFKRSLSCIARYEYCIALAWPPRIARRAVTIIIRADHELALVVEVTVIATLTFGE